MSRQIFSIGGIAVSMIFLLAVSATAQSGSPYLHEILGEIIDAQENAKYQIFGDIPGFTAGRLHGDQRSGYQLHLLRNRDESAQLLIVKITPERFEVLRRRVAERINAVSRNETVPAQAVYPIAESQWPAATGLRKLTLHDGTVLNGTFSRAQGDTLFVRTSGGLQVPVPDAQIVAVTTLQGEMREGQFYRTDPNTSRLLFAPTGRGLKSGQGYFADYYVFFPTLAIGVTDFLALSGGVSLVPGAKSQLAYFAPKLSFQASPEVNLATGFLYLAIPEETEDEILGYAVGTLGSNRSALTLGAGLSLSTDNKNLILLIGGETQVSNSAKLITENWVFTGNEATVVFSGGIRFFGEKLAVDLALLSSKEFFEEGGFPFVPWVDFSVFFGK
ncbi:MAG: hypothetical protein ONB44_01235 [candidate division KSB1 bacterium]|nr:hypothetical protein [candidate division KSB1 bacterium]MDZ7300744.1 hypothetical protein [candidate division KSB1 bacterium]MDZ7309986.1 hypothetical protein [candidate division KSB1 bacterium]